MDDLAVILPSVSAAKDVITAVSCSAKQLDMVFNITKCGAKNFPEQQHLNNQPIPQITADNPYKYLGNNLSSSALEGLDEAIQKFKDDVQTVMDSLLTPMQKLHAVRTHLLPKLFHLVENTTPQQSTLKQINSFLRKTTKRLCFLPVKATNAYIHLSRAHGGPGIPDLIWLRRNRVLVAFLQTMNSDDNFKQKFCELVHQDDTAKMLDCINTNIKAGLHPILKEVSSSLQAYCKTTGCQYQFALGPNNTVSLLKNGKAMPFPVTHLKAVATNVPLWELLKCKNQGRFWETLQHTPAATKNVYNFHTKMCDWRFIHRARLNLCPLNGAIVWSSAPKDCRRCQSATETLNHVTNSCSTQRKNMVKRHNAVRDHLEKWLPADVTYYKEQRFGNLQPDFVIETPAEIIIADIKVSVEDPIAMNQTNVENQKKYELLRNHFAQTGKRAHVTTLIFGALGSVNNICKYALHRIFHNARRANSTIRHLSEIVTHHSRNQVVAHITGVPQTY